MFVPYRVEYPSYFGRIVLGFMFLDAGDKWEVNTFQVLLFKFAFNNNNDNANNNDNINNK